jgi:hypothetical protein
MDFLPDIPDLKSTLRGFALCDAVLMPDPEFRYYAFNARWYPQSNLEMASIRNGEGAEAFFLFSPAGVAGKILFEQMLPDARPALHRVPDVFDSFKTEPAFSLQYAGFFTWRQTTDTTWHTAPRQTRHPTGLSQVTGGITAYHAWAQDYYTRKIDADALNQVFHTLTIDNALLERLDCERSLIALQDELSEITGLSAAQNTNPTTGLITGLITRLFFSA